MLTGCDFAKFGGRFDVQTRIGDGQGHPIDGPVHVRWIGREFMAVIDPNKDVSLLSMNGYIPAKLCNGIAADEAKRLRAVAAEAEAARGSEAIGEDDKVKKAGGDDEDHHFDYWFEEPQYLLTMEEKEAAAVAKAELERSRKDAPPPTRRINLRLEASDICRVPPLQATDSMRIGICDGFAGSVKVVEREAITGKQDNWKEVNTIGSRYVEIASTGGRLPGMFDKPAGIESVKCGKSGIVYFVCDSQKNKVTVLNQVGDPIFEVEGEGPTIDKWRQPTSLSCIIVRPKRVVDMILWEKEQQKLRQMEKEAEIEAEAEKVRKEEAEKRLNTAQLKKLKSKSEEKTVGLGKVDKSSQKKSEAKHGLPGSAEIKFTLSEAGGGGGGIGNSSDGNFSESPKKYKSIAPKIDSDGVEKASWYLSFADDDDMRTYLYTHRDSGKAGDFCVSRRVDNPMIFDLYYIADDALARATKRKKDGGGGLDDDDRGKGKGSIIKLTLRKQLEDKHRDIQGGILLQTATKGGGTNKLFPCIWDFIKTQRQLRMPIHEPRPYVLCAIADKGNFRVQVYRYFWTENEIYAPSFEFSHTIGGIKRLGIELKAPNVVSFSPTGELVILDVGFFPYPKLILLSQRSQLIKILELPFKKPPKKKAALATISNNIEGKTSTSIDTVIDKELNEQWPYWRQANECIKYTHDGHPIVTIENKDGEIENLSEKDSESNRKIALSKQGFQTKEEKAHDKHGKYMKGEAYLRKLEEAKRVKAKKEDKSGDPFTPTSASWSPDGALAVGYKNGGVLLYRPYKSYPVGNFNLLPLMAMNVIISYADYPSVVLLRNCCRFLHNHTKRLRARWNINPMRNDMLDCVIYHFMRWAVNTNDDRVYYGTNKENNKSISEKGKIAIPSRNESSLLNSHSDTKRTTDLYSADSKGDKDENEKDDGTKGQRRTHEYNINDSIQEQEKNSGNSSDIRIKETTTTVVDKKSSEASIKISTFTDTSHCYPYADIHGNILCEKYIQRICIAKHCPLKHGPLQLIGDSRHYPTVNIAGIELKHLKLSCYTVFSSRFVWSKERYIEALFHFYAISIEKYTRKEIILKNGTLKSREIMRNVITEAVPLLSMEYYMEIMNILEEDYQNVRRISKHPLFYRHSRFAPMSVVGDIRADEGGSISTSLSMFGASGGSKSARPAHIVTAAGGAGAGTGTGTVAGSVTGENASVATGASIAEEEVDVEDLAEEFKPYGPYDIDATYKRIYVDVLEQYDMSLVKNGINVPFLPLHPGNKKFLVMKDMGNETKGLHDTEVNKYTQTFENQTSNVSSMMSRLFN